MHYEIDGAVVGCNSTSYGTGMTTVLSGAQKLALNEESPTVDSAVISSANGSTTYVYIIFPELVDITRFMSRCVHSSDGSGSFSLNNLTGSTDTTNGADGTWVAITKSGNTVVSQNYDSGAVNPNWWRSTSPGTLSANNTGLKAIRFDIGNSGANNASIRSLHLWGSKHSGETSDDIVFLEGDGSTERASDDDWGDVAVVSSPSTHTFYVKNTSETKTANTITVKSSGSDSARWTVSKDNVTFSSSVSITSLAAGATQVIYVKFTPPADTAGNYRPFAAYLEADVTSWT